MAERIAPLDAPHWRFSAELGSLAATAAIAVELAAVAEPGDLLVLSGGLGAGKTAFTRAFAQALRVTGEVTSPTFVLCRIHPSAAGGPDLVHVDAYRSDEEGLIALDLPRTQSQAVTVAEWGRGRVEHILIEPGGSWLDLELLTPQQPAARQSLDPAHPLPIRTDFSETDEDLAGETRQLVLRGYGPRWAAIQADLRQRFTQTLADIEMSP